MDKKIIIGVAVVAIIAVIAVVAIRESAEKTPFEIADETIDAEFCRQLITRAQLKEITGYEKDRFVFGETEDVIDPLEIPAKICAITVDEEIDRGALVVMLPTVPISYDEFYKKMTKEMAEKIAWGFTPEGIREVQDVGERALSISFIMPDSHSHIIGFLEPDTNQVVKIMSIKLDYETTLNFAKQVEANLR